MILASAEPTTIILALIALGGPGLTFLGLRRKSSGRVRATEAETLWSEAEKMREVYREEAGVLRLEGVTLRQEVSGLRTDAQALRNEATEWRNETAALRREAAGKQTEIVALRAALRAAGILEVTLPIRDSPNAES